MRISASGHVGIGTTTPLPGAVTLEDATVPLFLRQAGGPTVGGAWRAWLTGSQLRFDANTADAGDFSAAMNLLALRAAGTGAPAVTVGSGGNVVLQTRHLNGKGADNDDDDGLYLNWRTGKPVEVGSDGHQANLLTHGEVAARNFPGDDTTQALASLALTSRTAGGGEVTWKSYTAAVGGGFGVVPAAYEIWHYGAEGGEPRFAIHADGNTYLNPSGGQLFIRGQAFSTSDARLKADVAPLDGVLGKLADLRGVSYRVPADPADGLAPDRPDGPDAPDGRDGARRLGVIAQEVERVFPELVTVSGRDGYKAVSYPGMTAVLVQAVNELAAEVDRLRARLADRPA
jgi:hypothetical protein